MSKEKDFYNEVMRVFVSASIYMLMFLVAGFIFYMTVTLFIEMISTIKVHMWYVGTATIEWINQSSTIGIQLAEKFLNTVTFILVLVKSFKILISYSKHHHISVKDLVEISIIGLLMEVVFNFWLHSMAVNWLFAVLAVFLVIIYAHYPMFHGDPHEHPSESMKKIKKKK